MPQTKGIEEMAAERQLEVLQQLLDAEAAVALEKKSQGDREGCSAEGAGGHCCTQRAAGFGDIAADACACA